MVLSSFHWMMSKIPTMLFFNGIPSVEMRNDFNVEIIKVNDGVKFKVVIPHPSRSIKVIGKYFQIASLFFITRSKMFLTFCAL
jgi:hypothetical protein